MTLSCMKLFWRKPDLLPKLVGFGIDIKFKKIDSITNILLSGDMINHGASILLMIITFFPVLYRELKSLKNFLFIDLFRATTRLLCF